MELPYSGPLLFQQILVMRSRNLFVKRKLSPQLNRQPRFVTELYFNYFQTTWWQVYRADLNYAKSPKVPVIQRRCLNGLMSKTGCAKWICLVRSPNSQSSFSIPVTSFSEEVSMPVDRNKPRTDTILDHPLCHCVFTALASLISSFIHW